MVSPPLSLELKQFLLELAGWLDEYAGLSEEDEEGSDDAPTPEESPKKSSDALPGGQ